MKTFILSDLDDTLFSSRRTHGEVAGLRPASYSLTGEALCFYSPQQRALVSHLQRLGTLIPVTGRSSESLTRVVGLELNSFRVVSHGALILDPQGAPLQRWSERVSGELERWGERLEEESRYVSGWAARHHAPLRVALIKDHGLPTYLSVKGEVEALIALRDTLIPRWREGTLHHNRRNLACLPPYASKERAVEQLIAHLRALHSEPLLFIGLGDSVSDVPFLKRCDLAITPQQSHIQQELWT